MMFSRNVPGMTKRLQNACIGIAGCGGLGSNAAMALVRAGIGKLILVDFDKVELSNLNRQHFFHRDLDRLKVDALSDHLLAVNPHATILRYACRLTPDNLNDFFADADILIEAFDRADQKTMLITAWSRHHPERPLICGNGLSGFGATNQLKVTQAGNIYFCGDLQSDMSMGLCSARVGIVANMQANQAIELLMQGECVL